MNIDDAINEIRIDTPTSPKTGKQYKVLVLVLQNGYNVKVFPHPAEVAVIESLIAGST